MIIAEQIAFLMNNDGTTFETDELELEDLCETELRYELLKWVDSIDIKLAQMHQEMEYTEECTQETYLID